MSELKSILLHLDAAANGALRLQLACRLAQAHGAHLEVLYAVLPTVLQYPYTFTGDARAATVLMDFEAEQRQRAKAAFERERQRIGAMADVAWHEATDEPIRALTQRAWAADLLVLGQHDPEPKAYSGVPPDFAAAVLVDCGKPGLVLPFIGTGPTLGQTVLIAWKDSREAARAVTAALPLLQRARRVHLASWDESAAAGEQGAELPIQAYLRRHGIEVTVHRSGRPTGDVGELLLSLAADLQADLLVMGCYGHGRAREWVLGGATRTVLASMTLPVLMVH